MLTGQREQQWTHTHHSLTMQGNSIRKLSESVEADQKDVLPRLAHLPRQMEENQQQTAQRKKYLLDSLKQDVQWKMQSFKTLRN